jgi:hypothetical protein
VTVDSIITLIAVGFASLQGVPVGTVRNVNVTSNENGAVAFRVTGNNPCGALHFIYGDGNAVTHPIVDLPTTITYRYRMSGDYAVTVQGMGNCQGEVGTRLRASVPEAAAEPRAQSGRAGSDEPGRGRGLARGRGRGNEAEIRFANMDVNRDRVITRDEWLGTPASFRVHDWNRDGVLSGAEIQMGAARPDGAVDDSDSRRRAVPNWTRQTFEALDRDDNGRITAAEWQYDAELFRRVDRNRDRSLTPAEFTATDLDDDRDDRFEYLDVNDDGYLSGTEWHGSAATFEWLDQNRDRRLSRLEVVGEDTPAEDVWRDTGRGGSTTHLRVPGNVAWRDTGLVVQAGDELIVRATGEIQWTGRAADRADAEGSLTGGVTPGAPLPGVFAGALIARVGRSAPFPVATDNGRVRMPQSGRLWLGINDDNVSDNRGEFEVTIQFAR